MGTAERIDEVIKGRALDLLRTHSLMAKSMQIDGQIDIQEIMGALETKT